MFGNFDEHNQYPQHYNHYPPPQGYYPPPGGYYPPPPPPGYYPQQGYPPAGGGYDPYGRDPYGRNPYGREPYGRGPSFTNVVLALAFFFGMGFLAAHNGCNGTATGSKMDAANNSQNKDTRQDQPIIYVVPDLGRSVFDPEKQQVGQPPTVPPDDDHTVQTLYQPSTPPATDWILLLDKFSDPGRAEHFQNAYQSRAIEIYTMTNGEYWAVIDLETEADCKAEKKDWQLHRKDSDGLILKVIQVSFKK